MSLLTQFYPGPGGGGSTGGVVNTAGGGTAGVGLNCLNASTVGSMPGSLFAYQTVVSTLVQLNSTTPTPAYAAMTNPGLGATGSEVGTSSLNLINFQGSYNGNNTSYPRVTILNGGYFTNNGNWTIDGGTSLTTISNMTVRMESGSTTTITAPNLEDLTSACFFGQNQFPGAGCTLLIQNAKLSQESVDKVLSDCAQRASFSPGSTVRLNGGTSAAPGSIGTAAIGVLTAQGWTVQTN